MHSEKIELTTDGIEVNSQAPGGISLKTSGARIDVDPASIDVNGGGIVTVNGAQVQLNGCKPVARLGDLVNSGQIATGSPTVCAGP
jgi:uncharacterized protein (DUF2345 family)